MRSLLLFLALLIMLPLPAHSAPDSPKVTLQAEAGFEGRARSGHWIPVTLTIANEGAEIDGSLAFDSRVELGPNRQTATYTYPVVVPAGATKRVTLYMPAEAGFVPTVRLMAGETVLAEIQPKVEITWDLMIGILGVEPAEVASLGGMKVGQRAVRLVRLTPDSLPAEPLALKNLDAILLDRLAWAEMPGPQQAALRTWVEHGGVLLAAGGPEVNRLEPLFPWLGLTLAGTESITLEGIGTAHLARPELDGWSVTHQRGEAVLAAQRSLGAGVVHFLTFDPALEPFASWSGMEALVRDLLTRGVDLSVVPGGGGAAAQKISMMLVDQLSQMEIREIPSTRRLLWVLGLYALLVGPVHLLLLRSLRRLGWALLTLPLLAAAGAGSAWAYMEANRSADVNAVSLGVVEGQPGGSSLLVRALTGFYLPPGASHTADLGGGLISPVPAPAMAMPGMPYAPTVSTTRIGEGRSVRLEPLEAWQMRAVGVEGLVAVDATVSGNLVVDGHYLTGTVRNRLPYSLKDALLIIGTTFHKLGDLAPDQAAEVEALLPGGQPTIGGGGRISDALSRALESNMSFGPNGPTPEQQRMMRRQQLSWALPNVLPWGESLDQPKVMLVGWLDTTGLEITVDGSPVKATATALYVQRMDYAFGAGEFSLPGEFSQVRVIESSSGMNQPIQWGWGMTKGGSVTLEHTVPAGLAGRISEMELRIPILDKGNLSETIPLTVEIYRWADDTWVEREFAVAGITLTPADGFLSPDGRLRSRLTKSSDAPLVIGAPGLAISGKGGTE